MGPVLKERDIQASFLCDNMACRTKLILLAFAILVAIEVFLGCLVEFILGSLETHYGECLLDDLRIPIVLNNTWRSCGLSLYQQVTRKAVKI